MAETSKDKLKVAGTMIHQGNFDKALSLVEEVLAKEPNHPEAWYYKARVFSDKNYKKISSNDKKTQEAFKSMEKMVENAPNAAYYFARKGELLTMIGGGKEIQEMIRDAYDQAYKLSPSNRSFGERLALACDQTGDHSRADGIRNSIGTYIPTQKRRPEAAPQPVQPGQPVSLPFIERLKKEYPEVKQLAIHDGDNKYRISGCLIDAFRGETPPEFYILIKGYEEGMPLIFGNSLLDKREINKKISIIKDKLKKQGYASGLVDWASDFWENVEAAA